MVDTTTLPPGVTNTVDPDGGFDSMSTVNLTLTNGPINLAQDFGYRPTAAAGSIGNLVWLDRTPTASTTGPNGPDGLPGTDDDEPGIAGVTIELYWDKNGNGTIDAGRAAGGEHHDRRRRRVPVQRPADRRRRRQHAVRRQRDRHGGRAWAGTGIRWARRGSNNNSQVDPYAVTLTPGESEQPDGGLRVLRGAGGAR